MRVRFYESSYGMIFFGFPSAQYTYMHACFFNLPFTLSMRSFHSALISLLVSNVLDPWHFGVDPYPGTFLSFFEDKKSKISHKTVGIKGFLNIFDCWPDPDPGPDPDPNPPLTNGSGFGSGRPKNPVDPDPDSDLDPEHCLSGHFFQALLWPRCSINFLCNVRISFLYQLQRLCYISLLYGASCCIVGNNWFLGGSIHDILRIDKGCGSRTH
jgi:hypothetical protein